MPKQPRHLSGFWQGFEKRQMQPTAHFDRIFSTTPGHKIPRPRFDCLSSLTMCL